MLQYPQVALDFMNRDHAEFVEMRDKVLQLLSAPCETTKIDVALDELLAHTRQHFGAEEQVMQEFEFPPYAMHKGEHDSIAADMAARIERWKLGRDTAALKQWMEQNVGDWFMNHVKTMDFVTAGYIAMKQQQRDQH